MEHKTESRVARFIAERIEITKKLQKDIADQVGFEKPNMITMIKQGLTKLPLDKAWDMAEALEVEPLILVKMCMEEYYPKTWQGLGKAFEVPISKDERKIIYGLRSYAGGSYLAGLSEESDDLLNRFLLSLRTPPGVH